MGRIGIYGGSFDPVHIGHVLVGRAALEELSLDRLIFVPAAQSPFKPGSEPLAGHHRARMLRIGLAGESRFSISLTELERGGVSFTIDTVREFQSRYPGSEIFLLIGSDHLGQLEKWRDAAELLRMVQFAVIPRPGEVEAALPSMARGRRLSGFPISISSSQIRSRIKTGLSIKNLVPPGVEEVICFERFYL